jgi:hypothetical protein
MINGHLCLLRFETVSPSRSQFRGRREFRIVFQRVIDVQDIYPFGERRSLASRFSGIGSARLKLRVGNEDGNDEGGKTTKRDTASSVPLSLFTSTPGVSIRVLRGFLLRAD